MSFRFATRWSLTTLALMAVACAANTASASLQSFGLYNTGVDNSGVKLPLGSGPASLDSHYTLTAAPPAVNLNLGVSATSNHPNWLTDVSSAASTWITPTAYATSAGVTPGSAPAGNYTYSLSFTSPGSWLTVTGRWSTDNGAQMFLNGSPVDTTPITAFSSWHDFTLNGIAAGSNTLTFVVNNATSAASPTGLRVEFLNYTVPEATSVAVWGGLSLLGVVARRRRS